MGDSARGYLGDSAEDRVWANTGIESLHAYGVKARVTADRFFDTSDAPLLGVLGEGGAEEEIESDAMSSGVGPRRPGRAANQ